MRNTNFNWPGFCVAGTMLGLVAGAFAQPAKPSAVRSGEPAKPDAKAAAKTPAPRARKVAAEIGEDPRSTVMPQRDSFDLTADQEERFKKYLPKAFAKLTKREHFHIVSIGDSVLELAVKKGAEEDAEKSYAAVLANEFATQFYYTGGVRLIRTGTPKPAKSSAKPAVAQLGPEISLRTLGREGSLMINATQMLTTYGFENPPDLVTVSFGINDAAAALNPATYARALQEVIETVRARGAELILLGPTLTIDDPAEESLGLTRAYADTMREIAADSGVLFVDLGDLAALVSVGESVMEPATVFDQIVKQYRRFFGEAGTTDFTHPSAEMHGILGNRIFTALTRGTEASPWSATIGTATFESADKFTLRYNLRNDSQKDAVLSVLPLVVREWKPMDASPQVTLKPGESKEVLASYARRPAITGGLPSHEPTLRLPALISGAGITRIADVRAEIRPFTWLLKLATMFNQEKAFALENVLFNTSGAALKGSWSAEWQGQKKNGDFSLAAGEKKALELSFALPQASDPWRQTGPVALEISAAGVTLRFDREVEVSRNIGLKEAVVLTPLSDPAKAPANSIGAQGVSLRADADANALYLTFEMSGFNLEEPGEGAGAFEFELGLDARSYGKRLGFGSVDSLRLRGSAADGTYPFESPPPWVFGTGYAATYDPKFIRSQLGSSRIGGRRLTVTLPRTYLYLHEWAIGNGNSQLGIRTNVAFWKGPRDAAPKGDFPAELHFSLVANGRHPDDAEGLAVLELTTKPTARWTVNPF